MADEDEPGIPTFQFADQAGVTYKQVDYWARAGLLRPYVGHQPGRGQGGVFRRWDNAELRVARLMGRLTAAGIAPRTAELVARSPEGRYEAGPGIWIQVDNPCECGGRAVNPVAEPREDGSYGADR